jgi:renalase
MARILIVGAGIAGLLAAHDLIASGHRVTLVDKGHRPGGRLATRRVGAATFDTGAQFLTARDPRFVEHVERWREAGVARWWFDGSPDQHPGSHTSGRTAHPTEQPPPLGTTDANPRFRGHPTMRSIAESLAAPLDVRLDTRVTAITAERGGWRVRVTDREASQTSELSGDALLLTPPAPQSLDLLTGVEVADDTRHTLERLTFDPCIAVLAIPATRPNLPARGAVRLSEGPVTWITDNLVSGASSAPAVTVHGAADWSRARYGDPDVEVARDLLAAAHPIVGTTLDPAYVHRWRYAVPTTRAPHASLLDTNAGAPLALAGDAFTGGRVEGAALSGLDAADRFRGVLADG